MIRCIIPFLLVCHSWSDKEGYASQICSCGRSQEVQDAVGSGISGGFAAKDTEGGLNVLLLERGHDLKHGSGYITTLG